MSKADTIECAVVQEGRRMGVLPRYLGVRHMISGEAMIFDMMRSMAAEYQGGSWDMLELSNDAFYMRPEGQGDMRIVAPNGVCERITRDAAGLVATLYALNTLAWRSEEDRIIALYRRVLSFAKGHAEAGKIAALID